MSITGLIGAQIDRRTVDAEALAEGPHPEMILVELLAPGQRAPRDQFVDVGVAGVVADLLALEPRPGRRRDDLARLGDDVAEADLLVFLGQRQMGVLAAGRLRQRLPGPAPRPRRWSPAPASAATSAASMSVSMRARPLVGPSSVTTPFSCLQVLDLVAGLPGDALDAVAELVHQRAERGEALVDVGIVALDDRDGRHGLAGDRLDTRPASSPSTSNGCAISSGLSCMIGVSTTSFSTPSTSGATAREGLGDAPCRSPSRCAPPRPDPPRSVSGWMKGCMSEVLRSFFSYQVAVGSTMSE